MSGALLGISFDGLAVSGLVVEFLKLAELWASSGHEVFLDLGFDIKPGRGRFFAPPDDVPSSLLPEWTRLTHVPGLGTIPGYNEEFVMESASRVASALPWSDFDEKLKSVAQQISEQMVKQWHHLGVDFIIVENGTLPENPAYTLGLQRAIVLYGKLRKRGQYVLWRDHDLMWTSEHLSEKYGRPPYAGVPQPLHSEYVQYVVQHEYSAKRFYEWTGRRIKPRILSNSFPFQWTRKSTGVSSFRREFDILPATSVIARSTRIIPQKRIDREVRFLAAMVERARASGGEAPVLCIAGATFECPEEYHRLQILARELNVESYVRFVGALAPLWSGTTSAPTGRWSVRDLLAEAAVSSFMPASDYESFGNPPAEAISCGRAFVAFEYDVYPAVYGGLPLKALTFSQNTQVDSPSAEDVDAFLSYLLDEGQRERDAIWNFVSAQPHFSLDSLPGRLKRLLPDAPLLSHARLPSMEKALQPAATAA